MPGTAVGAGEALDAAVKEYFEARRLADREELAGRIDALAGGDTDKVAAALRRVQIWPADPGNYGNFSIVTKSGPLQIGTYQLAEGYDYRKPQPVIICMPGEEYTSGAIMHQAVELLGQVARDSVLIAPHWPGTDSFHQPGPNAGYLDMLLHIARKRIHFDSDRMYLFGIGPGADAAWMTALMHPDLFAGVVAIGGYPKLPYPEATYGFMLENLRNTPVLSVWKAPGDAQLGSAAYDVAAANRFIVEIAKREELPISGVELPAAASDESGRAAKDYAGESILPLDEITKVLSRPLAIRRLRLSHWFRYPEQGRSGWLRQVEFKGRVWEDPQLSVLPKPEVDRNTFIADTLKDKLAFLGAKIDGQTIDIQTQRCARIELALTEGLVNWDSDITVSINGQRRHARQAEPSVSTMLESARDEWEFQHPAKARLLFNVRSDFRDK